MSYLIYVPQGLLVISPCGERLDIAINHDDAPTGGLGASLNRETVEDLRDILNDWLELNG